MGTYSMPGNKKPGGSGNETGADLPPGLTGWTDDLQNIDWAQMQKNIKGETEERKEKRQKKRRIRKKMEEGEKVLYGDHSKKEIRQYERGMEWENQLKK